MRWCYDPQSKTQPTTGVNIVDKQIEIVDDKVIMALEVFEDMIAEIDKLRQLEQAVGNLNGANDE